MSFTLSDLDNLFGELKSEITNLRQENAKLRGERSNRKKLSPREVSGIRSLWTRSGMSQRQIADVYDVNPATVSRIVRNIYWK